VDLAFWESCKRVMNPAARGPSLARRALKTPSSVPHFCCARMGHPRHCRGGCGDIKVAARQAERDQVERERPPRSKPWPKTRGFCHAVWLFWPRYRSFGFLGGIVACVTEGNDREDQSADGGTKPFGGFPGGVREALVIVAGCIRGQASGFVGQC